MIIWRGWGIIAPFILIGFAAIAQAIGQSLIPNQPHYTHYITWFESTGLLLGSLLCWFLGRYLNSKQIIIINEATGRVGRTKSRHTCWFIPFEYWSVVGILAILVILFSQ